MRAVMVSRKPCAEGSTTANVLKNEAGALNIDACRIVGTQTDIGGRAYNTNHPSDGHVLARDVGNNPAGRWPSNLVLLHRPGCRRVGTKLAAGYMINRWKDGAKPFGGGAGHAYESEQLPDAVVDVWECQDLCPVGALGEQTGGATASQFFKQVQSKDDDMAQIPDELRDYLTTMISPPKGCDPVLIVNGDLDNLNWAAYEDRSVHGMLTVGNPERHMEEIDRVLKPGAHLLIVAPDDEPTGHTGACAVENYGFEIRDAIALLDRPDDFHYVAKASPSERNAGIPEMEETQMVERLFFKEDADPVFVAECRDSDVDLSPEEPWTERDLREMFATSEDEDTPGEGWLENFERREVGVTTTHLNNHPTIKSIGIMERLLRDVPRDAGPVVDPFMGSGTTGVACLRTGHDFVGIEQDSSYLTIADHRIRHWDRAVAAWNGADITSEAQIEDDEPLSLGDFFGE